MAQLAELDKLAAEVRDGEVKDRLKAVQALRERVESLPSNVLQGKLEVIIPSLCHLLETVAPSMRDAAEHQARKAALDILLRLPTSEAVRSNLAKVLEQATRGLHEDNEENALVCLRVIFELHRTYKKELVDHVTAFIGVVKDLIRRVPETAVNLFGASHVRLAKLSFNGEGIRAETKEETVPADGPERPTLPQEGQDMLPASASFRVLTECPLIFMLLFQLFRQTVAGAIPEIVDLIMRAFAVRVRVDVDASLAARRDQLAGCQVKLLSFMTYLQRDCSEAMSPHAMEIGTHAVSLLRSCPTTLVSTRKELLLAIRHVLATEFRRGFFPHVVTLLDEGLLVGQQGPAAEVLKPLACSALADLVHHVRAELDISLLSRVVHIFSQILHDPSPSLPITIQTAAVRLLLNMVDHIFHAKNAEPARCRALLARILFTLVSKFGTLRAVIPKVLAADEARAAQRRRALRGGALIDVTRIRTRSLEEGGPDARGDASGAASRTAGEARGASSTTPRNGAHAKSSAKRRRAAKRKARRDKPPAGAASAGVEEEEEEEEEEEAVGPPVAVSLTFPAAAALLGPEAPVLPPRPGVPGGEGWDASGEAAPAPATAAGGGRGRSTRKRGRGDTSGAATGSSGAAAAAAAKEGGDASQAVRGQEAAAAQLSVYGPFFMQYPAPALGHPAGATVALASPSATPYNMPPAHAPAAAEAQARVSVQVAGQRLYTLEEAGCVGACTVDPDVSVPPHLLATVIEQGLEAPRLVAPGETGGTLPSSFASSSSSAAAGGSASSKDSLDATRRQRLRNRQRHRRAGVPMVGEEPLRSNTVRDVKGILRTMIMGLKTVVWCIANHDARLAEKEKAAASEAQRGPPLREEELRLLSKFFRWGLTCLRVHSASQHLPDSRGPEEGRDALDNFASVFTVLDPGSFRDLLGHEAPRLVDAIVEDELVQTVPQHFLANTNVSRPFAALLLRYLTSQLGRLDLPGEYEQRRANIILRLFKIAFGSVTLFYDTNEIALRPHLHTIVVQAVRCASSSVRPLHYLYLLRALFRSISGGKFEKMYYTFLPLLPHLLRSLMALHAQLTPARICAPVALDPSRELGLSAEEVMTEEMLVSSSPRLRASDGQLSEAHAVVQELQAEVQATQARAQALQMRADAHEAATAAAASFSSSSSSSSTGAGSAGGGAGRGRGKRKTPPRAKRGRKGVEESADAAAAAEDEVDVPETAEVEEEALEKARSEEQASNSKYLNAVRTQNAARGVLSAHITSQLSATQTAAARATSASAADSGFGFDETLVEISTSLPPVRTAPPSLRHAYEAARGYHARERSTLSPTADSGDEDSDGAQGNAEEGAAASGALVRRGSLRREEGDIAVAGTRQQLLRPEVARPGSGRQTGRALLPLTTSQRRRSFPSPRRGREEEEEEGAEEEVEGDGAVARYGLSAASQSAVLAWRSSDSEPESSAEDEEEEEGEEEGEATWEACLDPRDPLRTSAGPRRTALRRALRPASVPLPAVAAMGAASASTAVSHGVHAPPRGSVDLVRTAAHPVPGSSHLRRTVAGSALRAVQALPRTGLRPELEDHGLANALAAHGVSLGQMLRDTETAREMLVELCLTVPARLASLLRHLPLLVEPVVLALRSKALVNLGLRTLEFWVDNLNPDFLYPILAREPLLSQLMDALSALMRPGKEPHGQLALRVMGKLGGRNRRHLFSPISAPYAREGLLPGLAFPLKWRRSVLPNLPSSNPPPPGAEPGDDADLRFNLPVARAVSAAQRLLGTHYRHLEHLEDVLRAWPEELGELLRSAARAALEEGPRPRVAGGGARSATVDLVVRIRSLGHERPLASAGDDGEGDAAAKASLGLAGACTRAAAGQLTTESLFAKRRSFSFLWAVVSALVTPETQGADAFEAAAYQAAGEAGAHAARRGVKLAPGLDPDELLVAAVNSELAQSEEQAHAVIRAQQETHSVICSELKQLTATPAQGRGRRDPAVLLLVRRTREAVSNDAAASGKRHGASGRRQRRRQAREAAAQPAAGGMPRPPAPYAPSGRAGVSEESDSSSIASSPPASDEEGGAPAEGVAEADAKGVESASPGAGASPESAHSKEASAIARPHRRARPAARYRRSAPSWMPKMPTPLARATRAEAEAKVLRSLLSSLFVAAGDADLAPETAPILHGVGRHLVLLMLSHSRWRNTRHGAAARTVDEEEGTRADVEVGAEDEGESGAAGGMDEEEEEDDEGAARQGDGAGAAAAQQRGDVEEVYGARAGWVRSAEARRSASYEATVEQEAPVEALPAMRLASLSPFTWHAVLVAALGDDRPGVQQAAECALMSELRTLLAAADGVWTAASRRGSHVLAHLSNELVRACYCRAWRRKVAGCRGMLLCCKLLPRAWLHGVEMRWARALLFAARDHPSSVAASLAPLSRHVLHALLTRCYRQTAADRRLLVRRQLGTQAAQLREVAGKATRFAEEAARCAAMESQGGAADEGESEEKGKDEVAKAEEEEEEGGEADAAGSEAAVRVRTVPELAELQARAVARVANEAAASNSVADVQRRTAEEAADAVARLDEVTALATEAQRSLAQAQLTVQHQQLARSQAASARAEAKTQLTQVRGEEEGAEAEEGEGKGQSEGKGKRRKRKGRAKAADGSDGAGEEGGEEEEEGESRAARELARRSAAYARASLDCAEALERQAKVAQSLAEAQRAVHKAQQVVTEAQVACSAALLLGREPLDTLALDEHRRDRCARLLELFAPELLSSSASVRRTVQGAVMLLSRELMVGPGVLVLLSRQRETLMERLRTESKVVEVSRRKLLGMLDALRFGVQMRPPLFKLDARVLRLLDQVLRLAEVESKCLEAEYKATTHGTSHQVTTKAVAAAAQAAQAAKLGTYALPLLGGEMTTDRFPRAPMRPWGAGPSGAGSLQDDYAPRGEHGNETDVVRGGDAPPLVDVPCPARASRDVLSHGDFLFARSGRAQLLVHVLQLLTALISSYPREFNTASVGAGGVGGASRATGASNSVPGSANSASSNSDGAGADGEAGSSGRSRHSEQSRSRPPATVGVPQEVAQKVSDVDAQLETKVKALRELESAQEGELKALVAEQVEVRREKQKAVEAAKGQQRPASAASAALDAGGEKDSGGKSGTRGTRGKAKAKAAAVSSAEAALFALEAEQDRRKSAVVHDHARARKAVQEEYAALASERRQLLKDASTASTEGKAGATAEVTAEPVPLAASAIAATPTLSASPGAGVGTAGSAQSVDSGDNVDAATQRLVSASTREHVATLLFQCLLAPAPAVVRSSMAALSSLLAANVQAGAARERLLPKALLQSCVRPVLLSLGDHRSLSLPLLRGLSRLLKLLSSCFSHTMGTKLIDHLAHWADPVSIMNSKLWRRSEELEVAGAIVQLFHLLAQTPRFLEGLVRQVVRIEGVMHLYRSHGPLTSPLRAPLARYLARHPQEAASFFLKESNLFDPQVSSLFLGLLRMPEMAEVRELMTSKVGADMLMVATLRKTYQPPEAEAAAADAPERQRHNSRVAALHVHGLHIVDALLRWSPGWVGRHRPLAQQLLNMWRGEWRSARQRREEVLPLPYVRESKLLVKGLMSYCRENPGDVSVLFSLLNVFGAPSVVDYSFLADYYRYEVAHQASNSHRRSIVRYFLRIFRDPSTDVSVKLHALRQLAIPVVAASAADPRCAVREVLTGDELSRLVKEVLGNELARSPPPTKQRLGDAASHCAEELRIELLQMATLLVEFMGPDLMDFRKDMLKFAWDHLKGDGSLRRGWGYINVARFIEVFETPSKIVLQVYVALLRQHAPETRVLVRKALSLLVPMLPERLELSQFVRALRATRRSLQEDSVAKQQPQMLHVWHLLTQHPLVFYRARAHFTAHVVNVLGRMGLTLSTQPETRHLSVSLAHLIIAWERRRMALASRGTPAAGSAPPTPGTRASSRGAMEEEADGQSTSERRGGSDAPFLGARPPRRQLSTGHVSANSVTPLVTGDNVAPPTSPAAASAASAASSTAGARPTHRYFLDDYVASQQIVDAVVKFLMRMALTVSSGPEASESLRKRCLALYRLALHTWPHAQPRLQFLQHELTTITNKLRKAEEALRSATSTAGSSKKGHGAVTRSSATASTRYQAQLEARAKEHARKTRRDAETEATSLRRTMLELLLTTVESECHAVVRHNLTILQPLWLDACASVDPGIRARFRAFLTAFMKQYPPAPRARAKMPSSDDAAASEQEGGQTAAAAAASAGAAAEASGAADQSGETLASAPQAVAVPSQPHPDAEARLEPGAPVEDAVSGFYKLIWGHFQNRLNHAAKERGLLTSQEAVEEQVMPGTLQCSALGDLKLLFALSRTDSRVVDSMATHLVRLMQRLTKEHIQSAVSASATAYATLAAEESDGARGSGSRTASRGTERPRARPTTLRSLRVGIEGAEEADSNGGADSNAAGRANSRGSSPAMRQLAVAPSDPMLAEEEELLTPRFTTAVDVDGFPTGAVDEPWEGTITEEEWLALVGHPGAGGSLYTTDDTAGCATVEGAYSPVGHDLGPGKRLLASGLTESETALLSPADQSILLCIRCLSQRALGMPDHKRAFLQCVCAVAERSYNVPILDAVTALAEKWVFLPTTESSRNPGGLSAKEKPLLLTKMAFMERLAGTFAADAVFARFLGIVLRIFDVEEDEKRPKWALLHLSRAFMLGLVSPNAVMRQRFMQVFLHRLDAVAAHRLAGGDASRQHKDREGRSGAAEAGVADFSAREGMEEEEEEKGEEKKAQQTAADYVAGPVERLHAMLRQDWEPLSPRFWLSVATEMLLSAVQAEAEGSVEDGCTVPGVSLVGVDARLPPLLTRAKATAGGGSGASTWRNEVAAAHAAFLTGVRSMTQVGALRALRDLCVADNDICGAVLEELLPLAWRGMTHEYHQAMVGPLVGMLGRDHMLKQMPSHEHSHALNVLYTRVEMAFPVSSLGLPATRGHTGDVDLEGSEAEALQAAKRRAAELLGRGTSTMASATAQWRPPWLPEARGRRFAEHPGVVGAPLRQRTRTNAWRARLASALLDEGATPGLLDEQVDDENNTGDWALTESETPLGRNVVSTLLSAVSRLRPLPTLPAELLAYLGANFGCASDALLLAERQAVAMADRGPWLAALSRLHENVDSSGPACPGGDLQVGLSRLLATTRDSQAALALQSQGMWLQAQLVYLGAMAKGHANVVPRGLLTESELMLWEKGFVQCARELCQWSVLDEFSRLTGSASLLLDSSMYTGDWQAVHSLLRASPTSLWFGPYFMEAHARMQTHVARQGFATTLSTAPQGGASSTAAFDLTHAARSVRSAGYNIAVPTPLQGHPVQLLGASAGVSALFSGFGAAAVEGANVVPRLALAVQEKRTQDLDGLVRQGLEVMLHAWASQPRSQSPVRVGHLRRMHQLVELRESSGIAIEIADKVQMGSMPNLKNTLSTWRERLPNPWEPVSVWSSLLFWRASMFEFASRSVDRALQGFQGAQQQLGCVHDKPWTFVKLAHVARKHGLNETCLNSLHQLYNVATMDVHDAFSKLREQILVCLTSAREHRGGLNMVNNTNMSYFTHPEKAELFRLKGCFMSELRAREQAYQSFSYALQICPEHDKSWLSWAKYLDHIFRSNRSIGLAEEAITCFLEAVNHGCKHPHLALARVLWLVSSEDQSGRLSAMLQRHGMEVPTWRWVPWIPQLLSSLARPEAPVAENLLRSIVKHYPSPIYGPLRAFLLERRGIPLDPAPAPAPAAAPAVGEQTADGAAAAMSAAKAEQAAAPGSRKRSEELMTVLRGHHALIAAETELIVGELVTRFQATLAEELASALTSLLERYHCVPPRQRPPGRTDGLAAEYWLDAAAGGPDEGREHSEGEESEGEPFPIQLQSAADTDGSAALAAAAGGVEETEEEDEEGTECSQGRKAQSKRSRASSQARGGSGAAARRGRRRGGRAGQRRKRGRDDMEEQGEEEEEEAAGKAGGAAGASGGLDEDTEARRGVLGDAEKWDGVQQTLQATLERICAKFFPQSAMERVVAKRGGGEGGKDKEKKEKEGDRAAEGAEEEAPAAKRSRRTLRQDTAAAAAETGSGGKKGTSPAAGVGADRHGGEGGDESSGDGGEAGEAGDECAGVDACDSAADLHELFGLAFSRELLPRAKPAYARLLGWPIAADAEESLATAAVEARGEMEGAEAKLRETREAATKARGAVREAERARRAAWDALNQARQSASLTKAAAAAAAGASGGMGQQQAAAAAAGEQEASSALERAETQLRERQREQAQADAKQMQATRRVTELRLKLRHASTVRNPWFPRTQRGVMRALRRWRWLLLALVGGRPRRRALSDFSQQLVEMRARTVEVPGQYSFTERPLPASHTRVARFGDVVETVERHGFRQRRVVLVGDDGRHVHFLVQHAIPHVTRTDERVAQMQLLLNSLFARHRGCRNRSLALAVPHLMPLTPRVRLLEDKPCNISLQQVLEQVLERRGLSADAPMLLWRRELARRQVAVPAASRVLEAQRARVLYARAQEEAYTAVCEQLVSREELRQFMELSSPSAAAFVEQRRVFTKHLALSNLLSHLFRMGDRSPHKLFVSRSTGALVNAEFRPAYNANGHLDVSEAVPFRLSRNFESYLSPTGVEGPFTESMMSAAICLTSQRALVHSYFAMFLRDDLTSWHASKTQPRSERAQLETEMELRHCVARNVRSVVYWLNELAPSSVATHTKPGAGLPPGFEPGSSAPNPINRPIRRLIARAVDPQHLAVMPPKWHPWF